MSRHRIVIIGSGFAGLTAARRLKNADADITILARTRRHDQRVVFGALVLVVVAPLDGASLDVDLLDERLQNGHVLLAAQDLARGGGDVALGEDARGHLVEQGLEQVVRRASQDGDIGVDLLQSTSGREACETGADDDDAMAGHKISFDKARLILPKCDTHKL